MSARSLIWTAVIYFTILAVVCIVIAVDSGNPFGGSW